MAANQHQFGYKFPKIGRQDFCSSFRELLTKIVHFFPCTKETTTTENARLSINQVFRLHGMPKVIIFNCDPRFVREFFLNGSAIQYCLSSSDRWAVKSHHSCGRKLLRPYIEHHLSTWTAQLPLVEFAMNNIINVSTRFTEFYLDSG